MAKETMSSVQRPASSVDTEQETSDDHILVSFEPDDPANPHNWKKGKRAMVVVTATLISIHTTMGSALSSNLVPYLQKTFHVPDGPQTVLPASVFLVGLVFGPLIFAPLSEAYGRKPILLSAFTGFVLSTMSSALAPTWASFLIFRFLSGTFGAPPLSVFGGVIADVFIEERPRGMAMMSWSAATFLGPLTAPIISGFLGPAGWRWTFWFALIFSGLSSISLIWLPETLAAKLLRVKAAKLNKENHCNRYINLYDKDRGAVWSTLATSLSRPLRLLSTEMILMLTCTYMAFNYAVFYMLLVIFTGIFRDVYHMSAGVTGVAFLMIALGTIMGCSVQIWYDRIAHRITVKHPKKRPEYLRLPLACLGGPAFVVSLLWLGWASKPEIHWIVPLLATIPYGFSNQMIFMGMINYVADAYGVYAASAMAACAASRSLAGALIPLAVNNMLDSLGIAWSCTVLSFIVAVLSLVPFLFITFGEKIRKGSRFSANLQRQNAGNSLDLTRSLSVV